MRLQRLLILAATALIGGVAPTLAPAQPAAPTAAACTPGAKLQFICGVRNPEDLVQVPRTDWIIGSRLAVGATPNTGGLFLIESKTKAYSSVTPVLGKAQAPFDACPGPVDLTRFSAHGLSILPGSRGRARLFVIGHGAREATEVFEVASGRGAPTLTWIGCIPAPAGAQMNSVAALSDGRVIATDFYHAPMTMADALAGRNTGAVYAWKPGGAYQKLAGTDLPGPNGVEVSRDRRYLFVASTGTSSVYRYELAATEKPPTVVKTDYRTDNLRWGPDGKLLLAGPGGADPSCRPGPSVRCPMPSVVGALDPRTMALTTVLAPTPDPAFPGLSSALIVGRTLWLGSYNADRVAYTELGR